MDKYHTLLKLLRRYTGDAFTNARGYDLRKPLNFGQRMAVERYGEKLQELLSKPHITYKPKRGEKTAAFQYTGQQSFRKFDTAIIEKWNEKANLKTRYDRSRPAGSRFYTVDERPGIRQAYYHIPAELFLNKTVFEMEEIIRYYAPDCQLYIIQAGETYMWGASGTPTNIAHKIDSIFSNYGATYFQLESDHYYGNWFKGVTAFTHSSDVKRQQIAQALANRREYLQRRHVADDRRDEKYRLMKDGTYGIWKDGHYMGRDTYHEPHVLPKRPKRSKYDKIRGR